MSPLQKESADDGLLPADVPAADPQSPTALESGAHVAPAAAGEGIPSPPSPLDTGSAAQRRFTAVAEVVLCSSLPTQIVLGSLFVQAGLAPSDAEGRFSLPFVVVVSLADTALLIVLMVLLTRAHGESVSELWLGRRPLVRETLLGLSLVPVVFVMVVVLINVVRLLAPALHNVPANPLEELARGSAVNAAAFGAVAIIAGGVREELQRAFLLRRFERHLGGTTVGVLVLSVAFGAGHAVQGWDAAIVTGTLGLFWAVLYVRRRSCVAPLVSHAGFNSLEVLRVALTGS